MTYTTVIIAPAGRISVRMLKGETPVPLRAMAKDGADLPEHQQVGVEVSPRFGVGETADFAFTPAEPGTYELVIGPRRNKWRQRWEVVASDASLAGAFFPSSSDQGTLR